MLRSVAHTCHLFDGAPLLVAKPPTHRSSAHEPTRLTGIAGIASFSAKSTQTPGVSYISCSP